MQLVKSETFHSRHGELKNSFRYKFLSILVPVHKKPKIAKDYGFENHAKGEILLLTQPRCLGYLFNPVSFWLFLDTEKQLRVAIAEVANVSHQQHSYLVHHHDFAPISPSDKIRAQKIFHVSPFQTIAGTYDFKFDIETDRLGIWIDHKNKDQGVFASHTGDIKPMSRRRLFVSFISQPFGALRVMFFIHWQALKLKTKGAKYRRVPPQAKKRISR